MLRMLKSKRKEKLKWLKASGSELKKKVLPKKDKEEKIGMPGVYPISMPLRRKIFLPKMPDIKQEELKECTKELLKLKREQMLSTKSS